MDGSAEKQQHSGLDTNGIQLVTDWVEIQFWLVVILFPQVTLASK